MQCGQRKKQIEKLRRFNISIFVHEIIHSVELLWRCHYALSQNVQFIYKYEINAMKISLGST